MNTQINAPPAVDYAPWGITRGINSYARINDWGIIK